MSKSIFNFKIMKYLLFLSFLFISSCTLGNPFGSTETSGIVPSPVDTWSILTWELMDTSGILSGTLITQIEWWVITDLASSKLKITKDFYIKESYPNQINSGITTRDAWDKLISSINLDEFNKLKEYPATYCPSCADSPEEYITLTYGTGTKTIKYNETFDIIPTIEPARKILKDIHKYGISTGLESGIRKIRLVMMMWLSCPNCKDEIQITPDLIAYDKVILTTDSIKDTRPSAPIHFSWSLTSEEWIKFIEWLWNEAFSQLNMAPPPPDWEGKRLIVSDHEWEKIYIIHERAPLNPRITELLRQIEEKKQYIQNQVINGLPISIETYPLQKITQTISWMFGSTTLTVTPEKITLTNNWRSDINKKLVGEISTEEWSNLKNSIDMTKFLALNQKDPRLKCKTCAFDGENMESIEITYEWGSKKLWFWTASDVPKFDALESQLSELSKKAVNTPESLITSIEWWTSFWMCAGYCFNSLTFSSGNITERKTSYDETKNPTIINKYSLENRSWNDLLSRINLEKFNSLPDRIGCPDCTDGWAEWVKITAWWAAKNVIFENKKSISEIDELRKIIQKLSQELSKKDGSISRMGEGYGE